MVRCKRIDDRLTLIFTPHFPYNKTSQSRFRHTALIGIGGNVGDTLRRFEKLWWYLARLPMIDIEATSPILKNPPFGYAEQPDFDNAVMRITTDLSPKALLRLMQRIERHFGRRRSFKNAPRTLDADILFYDDRTVRTETLSIPHPHWSERESVLIPMQMIQR